MLLPYERLIEAPVMSLQTGAELARTQALLIDPRTLTVIAYQLTGPLLDEHPSFLRVADVRELSTIGLIVDSSDEFVGLDDVIAIKTVHDFGFTLLGIEVIDEKQHKLGKVHGYIVDAASLEIMQLSIKRPLLQSLTDTELLVHRTQVVEVTNERIVVKTTAQPEPVKTSLREYANPFRQSPAPQSDVSSTND